MTKAFTGKDGSLMLDGQEQIKVTSWTLMAELEMLETTSLGQARRSFTPGVQSFNGTASILYFRDANGRNDASTMLRQLFKTELGPGGIGGVTEGQTVTLSLRLVDGLSDGTVTLRAYITSASVGAAVGEIVSAQISFQATGALITASM